MKTLIQNLSAFFLVLTVFSDAFSQDIEIDLTFTGDTVLYPFENIETFSELTMDGNVEFYSDTSLVRLILEDENGYQYMIFETFPLISSGSIVYADDYCDETCTLNECNPYSLIVQVINAEFLLKDLYYEVEAKQNAEELRYEAKRAKDSEKIQIMNKQIPAYGMNWTAEDNGMVEKYYEQKKHIFGDGYSLLGFEYYKNGVFEFIGRSEYPKADPDLVRQFDWRDRHGANDSSSEYWDGDPLGTGWITSVKDQDPYATCWAFSAAGLVETMTNLYANDNMDFDLSEQHLISCVEGDCDGGNDTEALSFVVDSGIVTEQCFPYDTVNCPQIDCEDKCSPPTDILKINDTFNALAGNHDSVRIALINYGPCSIAYHHYGFVNGPHSVNIIGYIFDLADSTVTWIIKNSWGIYGWGENGIGTIKIPSIWHATFAETPVFINDTAFLVNCYDHDQDGYCFWGIGKVKPENCNCTEEPEDCNDNDPFVGPYDENYNCSCLLEFDTADYHITSDTTWSDTTYVNYQVVIDSGACLTISTYAAFVPEASIQVRHGGKLILDSAYLTKVCPEYWQGIEVLGSDTLQALDEYFGKVVVRNNSMIEFAETAIANHCRSCNYEEMQCGGIISAENSIFRDNVRDIQLNPFSTYWFDHELPYACVISDCRFLTTDNCYPDQVPKAHIEMKDIYGVMIYGCRFENQSNLDYNPYPIRGTGISSIDSYFMINPYCLTPNITPCENFDTCKFSSLEYGIKAMNSRSKRTLNIQGLQFDTNLVAISLSGLENAAVLSNEFNLPKKLTGVTPDRFAGGLFMEGCTGYHVEDNSFIGETQPMVCRSPANGIGVKNSGTDNNEIYNNDFQKVNIGIISIGENRGRESGLCLKCNDMYSNLNDFLVFDENDPPLGTYQGINRYQGDPVDSTSFDAPAGNIFSNDLGTADSLLITNYNYYNNAEYFYYTHHFHQYIQVNPMEDNYTSSTIELKGWTTLQYNKATACPSGLGGGGLKTYSSPRSTINEVDVQMDILETQLDLLVDGGNTEALNFEVMTSLQDEGLEISQELISTSPYLSDTVLKQAIYKEDVLPNAMIRDVLQANPQSAKSDEILSTLESRYEPMPDYMMAQIMEGKKYLGAKEVLEAKIQFWQQIRSKAKADLMREFLLDTNMISPLDSVILFLENESDLNSKYDLALAQWNNFDPEGAWFTLNGIPSQFTLNEKQSIDHENYTEYFSILQTLSDYNWQASQLDSTSVATLFYLKETGNPRIAALARGLLMDGGFFDYIETINFPTETKSYNIPPDKHKQILTPNKKEEYLWLFPNPAGDYVIAYYNLDLKYEAGEIHLFDVKGILLRSYPIICGKDQMVIDLKDYPVGFYMISLNSRNQVIDSKKLSKGGK